MNSSSNWLRSLKKSNYQKKNRNTDKRRLSVSCHSFSIEIRPNSPNNDATNIRWIISWAQSAIYSFTLHARRVAWAEVTLKKLTCVYCIPTKSQRTRSALCFSWLYLLLGFRVDIHETELFTPESWTDREWRCSNTDHSKEETATKLWNNWWDPLSKKKRIYRIT